MFLKLGNVIIEDRCGYAPAVVESLRALLAGGVRAELDPHRGDCYDLEDGARAYYIYVSPVNGRVVLLAACLKQPREQSRAAARPPFFTKSPFGPLALVP